jgi:hypothetical protein
MTTSLAALLLLAAPSGLRESAPIQVAFLDRDAADVFDFLQMLSRKHIEADACARKGTLTLRLPPSTPAQIFDAVAEALKVRFEEAGEIVRVRCEKP